MRQAERLVVKAMSSPTTNRSRAVRVQRRVVIPGGTSRWASWLRDTQSLQKIGWCALAALVMLVITEAWAPGFPYRRGYVPPRDIAARVAFRVQDEAATEARRRQARSETICVYQHDPQPLLELRKALKNRVFQLLASPSYDALDKSVWVEFVPKPEEEEASREWFDRLRAALASDMELMRFERAVQLALADYERNGLLENLTHRLEEGSQLAIWVHPVGNEQSRHRAEVREVRIAEATANLEQRLAEGFQAAGFSGDQITILAAATGQWLRSKKLPTTLTLNAEASERARREAAAGVQPVEVTYQPGTRLVPAGRPLQASDVALLQREHEALLERLSWPQILARTAAVVGLYVAMYVLCGTYIYFHERRLLRQTGRLAQFLAFAVMTVILCVVASRDDWRAETIPLTLFSLMVTIAYHRELALMASTAVALVVVLTVGFELYEFILLMAAAAAPALLVGRIRHRTRLIMVGALAGAVVAATTVGLGTVVGQTFGSPPSGGLPARWLPVDGPVTRLALLLAGASWYAFCSLLAGLVMTGLLPFVERWFDVQTDLSLLELGDPAHPLLQELARRAPGTYNHSINVAALGEAAAETIGANGLLVRVGAYFHDIGKMLKPEYFVENQGLGPNPHGALVPAMSTLVIISHVKDGVELARRHHLPKSIIDFIEQHHGTTLVAYFYGQAAKLCADDPDQGDVDETTFRYPGPKPQTKEAAVMMLADAAESASRTLIDPTPSRIENLVHEIALNKLLDGQFDECGLTLRELRLIEESLVKSINAFYHTRVKYPDQQTV